MIKWSFFPRNKAVHKFGISLVDVFEKNEKFISSESNNHLIGSESSDGHSNTVLEKISSDLLKIGFMVEHGKKKSQKINVPVLFGEQGKPVQSFDADAYNKIEKFVLEVEAGRAVTNYQFLKDYFQACMMVDVEYLAIAVRKIYRNKSDYETVCNFFDALYASGRIRSELKGVLIIGY